MNQQAIKINQFNNPYTGNTFLKRYCLEFDSYNWYYYQFDHQELYKMITSQHKISDNDRYVFGDSTCEISEMITVVTQHNQDEKRSPGTQLSIRLHYASVTFTIAKNNRLRSQESKANEARDIKIQMTSRLNNLDSSQHEENLITQIFKGVENINYQFVSAYGRWIFASATHADNDQIKTLDAVITDMEDSLKQLKEQKRQLSGDLAQRLTYDLDLPPAILTAVQNVVTENRIPML